MVKIGKTTSRSPCARRDRDVFWAIKQANLTHKIIRRGATDDVGRIQRLRSRLEDLDSAGKGKATREPNGGQDASDTNIIGECFGEARRERCDELKRERKATRARDDVADAR